MSENISKLPHLPFLTAKTTLNNLYSIVIEDYLFIEMAYPVWREIGNIATTTNSFSAIVPEDGILQLPSSCEFIEAVTTVEFNLGPDEGYFNNYQYDSTGRKAELSPNPKLLSGKSAVRSSSNLVQGESVSYDLLPNNCIKISSDILINKSVFVYYKSILVGEDNLPLLDDKEVTAIAINVALRHAVRDMFMKVKGADTLVGFLTPKAAQAIIAARIPEKISDHTIDRALDIKNSWDRKTFGNRFRYNR